MALFFFLFCELALGRTGGQRQSVREAPEATRGHESELSEEGRARTGRRGKEEKMIILSFLSQKIIFSENGTVVK